MTTTVALAAARRARGELVTWSRGTRIGSVRVLWGEIARERRDTQAADARLSASQAAVFVPAAELLLDGEAAPITPQLGDTVTAASGQIWRVVSLSPGDPVFRELDRTSDWLKVFLSR
jgi:hypothetical protein